VQRLHNDTLSDIAVPLGRARVSYDNPAGSYASRIKYREKQNSAEFALEVAGFVGSLRDPMTAHWAEAVRMVRHVRPRDFMPEEFGGAWPHERLGHPTWEAFVTAPVNGRPKSGGGYSVPPGLGLTLEKLAQIEAAFDFVRDNPEHGGKPLGEALHSRAQALAADPAVAPLAEPGNPTGNNQYSGGEESLSDKGSSRGYGTSAEYLVRRLKRDAPEVAQALARGEYPSARAAGVAAGIVKLPTALDELRRAWKKATAEDRAEFARSVAVELRSALGEGVEEMLGQVRDVADRLREVFAGKRFSFTQENFHARNLTNELLTALSGWRPKKPRRGKAAPAPVEVAAPRVEVEVVVPACSVPGSEEWKKQFVNGARRYAFEVGVDAMPLRNCVAELKKHRAWEIVLQEEPRTWERFCVEFLNMPAGFVDAVCDGVEILDGEAAPAPVEVAVEEPVEAAS
jgi:hypothetical protein